MADNITLNAGSGGVDLRTDETATGKHVQIVKLALSADASDTPITADADGLEVQGAGTAGTPAGGVVSIQGVASGTVVPVSDGGGALTVDGTVAVTGVATEAKQDTQITALQLLDDVVRSEDEASASGHAGAVVLAVRQDTPAAKSGTDGDYEPLTVVGGRLAVQATASGTFTVDGSGVTQPVSHAALTELAAAIDTEVQCDIVGALPTGTNAIGKLAANSGVDIGDTDVTSVIPGSGATNLGKAEDGGHTSGDVGVMVLGVRNDTPNAALAGTDLDYSPIGLYRDGSIRVAPPESDFAVLGSNSVKKYYTNAGAVTDGIVWSPAAGKRWYVTDIFINVSAAATVTLEDDKAGGDEAVWKAELAANSGWSHSFSTPFFSGEDAADLIITTTAGNVYVTIAGYEI
jgi:hypothetical protein